ncbi:hypothetical protein POM88_008368 [Heracleum sosnowskyi]|uniref:Uncharacterized protein n=1 Tax=Heracleum sosnowskyi TaxID=360622 RepID=A0AAD8N1N2_9APIA|nr:hypothetical protein POM88_008368 [Heracleum sosnowskyi]
MTGLKINFQKSSVDGYGSVKEELPRWANNLGCQVGNDNLKYLGAVLGDSPSSLAYWSPLVNKFNAKLKTWDTSSVLMANRLVLLKTTLDSIPNFWFNLFKIPSGIIQKLERIRKYFLWGEYSGGTSVKKEVTSSGGTRGGREGA